MKASIPKLKLSRRRRLAPIGALVAALGLIVGMSAPAMADGPNLVINGNFSAPHTDNNSTLTSLPGWTLNNGQAELIGGSLYGMPSGSAAGTQALDLNPTGTSSIQQAVPTTVGKTYTLTYAVAGNMGGGGTIPVKTGAVSVSGASPQSFSFDIAGHTTASPGWVVKSLTFTATVPSTLVNFQSTMGGNYGPAITNVSLVETADPGLPMADWQIGGAALLGLMTLIGLGAVLRRRRSVAIA